jgi:hypothetical protein
MAKRARRYRATTRIAYPVATAQNHELERAVRHVIEAVRLCPAVGSWRKKDLLRGRTRPLHQVLSLVIDLHRRGAAPAEIEGVLLALLSAVRRVLRPSASAMDFSDAIRRELRREQERENTGNFDTHVLLGNPTVGELWQCRQHLVAEMESEQCMLELIDARLLTAEQVA